MRVRPNRATTTRRLASPTRRLHLIPRPAEDRPAPEPAPADAEASPADDHPAERRARLEGGPVDRAQYTCGCGYVFQAAVCTTVTCPHCGAGQAW